MKLGTKVKSGRNDLNIWKFWMFTQHLVPENAVKPADVDSFTNLK